ncbi:MAG: hypothetical protein GXY77_11285, partial [Fibrobacter sp.]|nr:hypothetical protein [Fibrobacter sp.]
NSLPFLFMGKILSLLKRIKISKGEIKWKENILSTGFKSVLYTIGGKTTHKPSEINGKNKFERHKDYGLFKIEDLPDNNTTRQTVDDYINSFKPPEIPQNEKWPDLRYFFFSQKALNRLDINKVIGLDRKGKLINNVSDYQKFLRGRRGVSKKIFSFHTDNRTWGYLNKKLFVSWKNELEKMTGMNTKWGKDIIDEFFK